MSLDFLHSGVAIFFFLELCFSMVLFVSSNFGYKIWTLSKDYFGSWKAFGVKKTVQF